MIPGLSPDVNAAILGHGPAGLIITILLTVSYYLFRRWDQDRELRIQEGAKYAEKYAEIAFSTAKAIDTANANAVSMITAVQTVKLLSDIKRPSR